MIADFRTSNDAVISASRYKADQPLIQTLQTLQTLQCFQVKKIKLKSYMCF